MTGQIEQITKQIDDFMDAQLQQVSRMLDILQQLRSAVIRCQEEQLCALQSELVQEEGNRLALDQQQHRLQEQIATFLAIPVDQVCISKILEFLSEPLRSRLDEKRLQLQQEVRQLRQEHLGAELLLRECTRLNRKILEVMLGQQPGTGTYDAQGRMKQPQAERFMSLKI